MRDCRMVTTRRLLLAGTAIGLAAAAVSSWRDGAPQAEQAPADDTAFEVAHADADWRSLLTADQYPVLQQSATDLLFTPLSPMKPGMERTNDSRSESGCLMCSTSWKPSQ